MPTRFEDWKNTCPSWHLPSAPTPWAVLTSQPMLMVRIIFSLNQHDYLSVDDSIYLPIQTNAVIQFLLSFEKEGLSSSERQRGTFYKSSLLSNLSWVFTLHMSTGFSFCLSEQGLQFPYSDHELCTPDSSITTRMQPHFHVCTSPANTLPLWEVLHRTTALG